MSQEFCIESNFAGKLYHSNWFPLTSTTIVNLTVLQTFWCYYEVNLREQEINPFLKKAPQKIVILTSRYSSRPNLVNSYWRWTLKFISSTEWTTILINCIEATWNEISKGLNWLQVLSPNLSISRTHTSFHESQFTLIPFSLTSLNLQRKNLVSFNKRNQRGTTRHYFTVT